MQSIQKEFKSQRKVIEVNDYESMILWHPEMILISENPVTWQGFLTVSSPLNLEHRSRIKLKLIVPHYPSLYEADIYFGKKGAFVNNQTCKQTIINLMETTRKVSTFLRHLQSVLGTYIQDYYIEDTTNTMIDNTTISILEELKDTFDVPSEVQLLSDENLHTVQFTYKNVSILLERSQDNNSLWKLISSDLPEIPAFASYGGNLSTLNVLRNKFKSQVEMLETTWSYLQEIDEMCCILAPVKPKPSHLYRRIYLSSTLSMLVRIDPLNPTDLPEIKFLGSESEVEMKKDIVSSNIQNWDPDSSVLNNLMVLLDIYEFPIKETTEKSTHSECVLVRDEECCICWSPNLDGESLPDKICNNEKCMRHFHTSCLLQWLQAAAGNRITFNHIHGACPHCGEDVSCPID